MPIRNSELKTARGSIVGIGRVKIPKMLVFNHEIPMLSFIATKRKDGYISTCIHLQIDGYGKNLKDAKIDMVSNILYFLRENFGNEKSKNGSWENILDLFKSNPASNILWDKYHAFQVILAEKGISTDNYSLLQEKINQLQEEVDKLKKEIKKMKNNENNEFISEIIPYMIINYEAA